MLKVNCHTQRFVALILVFVLNSSSVFAGLTITNTQGVTMTGVDGVKYVGINGVTMTGVDNFLTYGVNGVTMTGVDGTPITGPTGVTMTGVYSTTFTSLNSLQLTQADGVTMTGVDGLFMTGPNGVTMTGVDGTLYQADSITIQNPTGVTMTGVDGVTMTGVDGVTMTGVDTLNVIRANGVTMTGVDDVLMTGADSLLATRADGTTFSISPNGVTMTGVDTMTLVNVTGVTMTGVDGVTMTGVDDLLPVLGAVGLQGFDAELAVKLNQLTDDSNVNAIVVYHSQVTNDDIAQLHSLGVIGGTRYRALPMVCIIATKQQILEISRLPRVRSIYGNRTLNFNSDPRLNITGLTRVPTDGNLTTHNGGLPVSGQDVTVAVLDTGVDGLHGDLAGRVIQNVKLLDTQGAGVGFLNPVPLENLPTTDLVSGHGTFVSGIIAGTGALSGGRYNGVAPGAQILGLSAGELTLSFVLAGFDYILDRGANYNTRVVNCSFSADVPFDFNDPVNIATKMLTDNGVNVVFSAGNTGPGFGTLNPYAVAPWVISVGATDDRGRIANFSSRGVFGNTLFRPTVVAPGIGIIGPRSIVAVNGIESILANEDLQRLSLLELPFYTTASGTSFTAPQVSGTIALMLDANPNLTPAQIKDIIQRTATPLPPYYSHEVGAGMLNVHAAVLEAAFPQRRMGLFRATLDRGQVSFVKSAPTVFNEVVQSGGTHETTINLPENTLLASVQIAWGPMLTTNDLGLTLRDPSGTIRAQSNILNLPILTGRRERVVVTEPSAGAWRATVNHTVGLVSTTQPFNEAIETVQAQYVPLTDVQCLDASTRANVFQAIRNYTMLPYSNRFRPTFAVKRSEFALALLMGGRIPQYIAGAQMFTDVRDTATRGLAESAQNAPVGPLFYDSSAGGVFRPNESTTRLVAAVALVRAAGLRSEAEATNTLCLPLVTPPFPDFCSIPASWRGYAVVALNRGLLRKHGANFDPNQPLTRAELAQAISKLIQLSTQ